MKLKGDIPKAEWVEKITPISGDNWRADVLLKQYVSPTTGTSSLVDSNYWPTREGALRWLESWGEKFRGICEYMKTLEPYERKYVCP